jgi:hypothetical protein
MADFPNVFTTQTLSEKVNPPSKENLNTDNFVKKAKAIKDIADVAKSILGENVVEKFLQGLVGMKKDDGSQLNVNQRAQIEAQNSTQPELQPSKPSELDIPGALKDLEVLIQENVKPKTTVKELMEMYYEFKETGIIEVKINQFLREHTK